MDDLLVWAAETSPYGARRPKTSVSAASADEPQSSTQLQSVISRAPSPNPKTPRKPRWFDIGHCAAACSGRCSLHAKQEQQEMVNEEHTSLRRGEEPLQTQQRRHRRHGQPSAQRNDGQNLRLSSNSKPMRSEGYRNSRLDLAREALLNGNTAFARSILEAELERLGKSEGM